MKIDQVEAEWLSAQVEQMAGKPVGRLAELIPRFVDERFLYDYGEDLPLCYRLNQVLNRVGLPQLPGQFVQVLPSMREEVHRHQNRLLSEPADAMRLK